MGSVTFWLQFLLSVLALKQSDAVSDQCSELQNEISSLERHILKSITELKHWNDIQEQQKTETHVSENNFSSLKWEEYEFKSKLQQSEGVISSVKKQLEAKDGVLQINNTQQVQLHTTIDGLTETVESINQTARVLCEKLKQLQATIDGLTKTEEANNRTVQELREKQKQLQADIEEQTKTVEALNQTVPLLCMQMKYACQYLLDAAKDGDVNTVKILFKCTKENCIADNWQGNTPLIYAANYGHLEVVRVLLEGGANTERRSFYQQTALHIAAWNGHLDICRLLLDWGAKVAPQDKWEDTPLHDAARKGYMSVVKLLVERGADVRLKNDEGQTASDRAREEGYNNVADWLDSVSRG